MNPVHGEISHHLETPELDLHVTERPLTTATKNLKAFIDGHLEDAGGLLRLSLSWVPRSFFQSGLCVMPHPAAAAMGGCKNA